MERRVRGIIFDQDGLMYDTERISGECWGLAGQEFGFVPDEAFLSTIRGKNRADVAAQFRETVGDRIDFEELYGRKMEYFHQLLRERGVPVKPGLYELLAYLQDHGYKIVLATASTKEYSVNNLRETGIEQYFVHMVTGDMVAHAKPDPEVFLRAAREIGEEPEHCMVLEDSLNGVEAGLRGGFVTVMVPDLTQPDEALRARVDAVCGSLHDVIGVLERLNGEG